MVNTVALGDLMGVTEIGEFLGVSPRTVSQWRQRGIFPPADLTLEMGDLWTRNTVTDWATKTGRLNK